MAHAIIGHQFHFTEAELWNMDEDRLSYWLERAKQSHEFFNGKT
jgi:hypothetical protein